MVGIPHNKFLDLIHSTMRRDPVCGCKICKWHSSCGSSSDWLGTFLPRRPHHRSGDILKKKKKMAKLVFFTLMSLLPSMTYQFHHLQQSAMCLSMSAALFPLQTSPRSTSYSRRLHPWPHSYRPGWSPSSSCSHHIQSTACGTRGRSARQCAPIHKPFPGISCSLPHPDKP